MTFGYLFRLNWAGFNVSTNTV